MLQQEILHKRNLFVYYSLLFVNCIYYLMIAVDLFHNLYIAHVYFTVSALIVLGLLFLLKVPQQFMFIIILLSWNISSILLILGSLQFIAFFWFIFLIVITMIYRSPVLSSTLFGISSFVTIIILKLNYESFKANIDNFQYTSLLFVLMVVIISAIQIFYVRKVWNKQEQSTIKRERELSSKEGYMRLFFENADDAIAVFDLERKIIDVNPAFEKLYGWTRVECIGNSLPLIPPNNIDASNQRYERIIQGKGSTLLTTQDMRKDGTLIDVQMTLSPIFNEHGEIIASSVISRDISYMKENERLVMQSEKLKIAGEMAAGLAHEIRNPMTVISGFVQMMNADENSPFKNYTELIQSEIERINLITTEFLVLSRPQKERYSLFSLNKLLDDIIEFYSLENEQKNIIVTKETNDVDGYIEGSPNQIKQVFINLIKNAIEAIELDGAIQIELCRDHDSIYVYLKDDGCGIPDHVMAHIFEPFYTTKSKGTGLGMMITKKIIEEHKGTIKIRSQEKVGTELLIQFPCIEVTSPTIGEISQSPIHV